MSLSPSIFSPWPPRCHPVWVLQWPSDQISDSRLIPPPPGHEPLPQTSTRVVFTRCRSDPIISLVEILQQLPTPLKGISDLYQGMNKDLLKYTLLSSILSHQSLNHPNPQWAGKTIRTIRTSKVGMLKKRTLRLNIKIFKGGWGFKESFKVH